MRAGYQLLQKICFYYLEVIEERWGKLYPEKLAVSASGTD
jgi:hypothetical protein